MKQLTVLLMGIISLSLANAQGTTADTNAETGDAAAAIVMSVDEEVKAATTSAVIEAKDAAAAKVANTDAKKVNVDESKIPVLTKDNGKPTEASNPYVRLVLSFFVIAGMAIGLVFFSRWFSKRQGGGKEANQKIQMVSQLHLGPRKSLAVVRVSGETILVGITDNNINLIKGLSLIDDEAEVAATNFATQLQTKADSIEDVDLRAIKDQITRKTTSMRQLT